MHWEISGLATLHTKLGSYDIRRLKACGTRTSSAQTAGQKAACRGAFSLLSLETGKWEVGDADAMFDYLLGGRGLGDEPNEFATAGTRSRPGSGPTTAGTYASLTAATTVAKYVAAVYLYMTAVRGVHALYEIYQGKRPRYLRLCRASTPSLSAEPTGNARPSRTRHLHAGDSDSAGSRVLWCLYLCVCACVLCLRTCLI